MYTIFKQRKRTMHSMFGGNAY